MTDSEIIRYLSCTKSLKIPKGKPKAVN